MSNVIIMACIAVVSIVIGYALGYFLKIKATEKTASRILLNEMPDDIPECPDQNSKRNSSF